MSRKTWMARTLAGKVVNLEQEVARWFALPAGDSVPTLPEWLGMTQEEYNLYAELPHALPAIVVRRGLAKRNAETPAAQHRAESEPRTRARVEGMIKERFGVNGLSWIDDGGRQRHVSVKIKGRMIEGSAATWLDAMDDVERQSKRKT